MSSADAEAGWDWSEADLAALEAFLAKHGVADGPLATRRIGDGHSNLTYLVRGSRDVVVRRPPPPPLPPGAHDVLREARLLAGLAGTGVPVPEVLATAETGEVIDSPLYVMSHVPGAVVTTRTPPELAEHRRAIGESMVDILARLHAVDWQAAGLAEMGRPEGFNGRHLRRMRRLVADADGNPPAAFADIDAWLEAHVPAESGATLVHNDYRLGNVILGPTGTVAAVLDWELATIGDPLFDVGYFLASWPVAGKPLTPTAELGAAVLEPGYATRDELAERYAGATGRDLSGLRWYTALALWKLAVLYEYSHRRATAGHGDPYYADPGLVQSFLAAAHRTAGI
ncbi:phosphotransferase family protein [Pseudonocardia halophobica]|uniref:Aminoglycoside phosphotransferase n=1 Tax=Pseudonocardia halophobica TaxID=29401 RepID=A0A9W6KYD8_9PSEU|nr:phosphotransferase family protein [Pseudonocardia halophobica]GLL09465.1 aminoglycoside phosphotransferase [Pseudonocardia halophobica]